MSFSFNKVYVAGNLTRDPQVKFLANEKAVCEFGIAVNHKYKAADGSMKEEVTFVECVAWGRTAELVGQYLTKGSGAFVEGRLKQEEWDDKEGKKQRKTKVTADSVQFTSTKKDGGGEQSAAPAPAPRRPAADVGGGQGSDEPPFAQAFVGW